MTTPCSKSGDDPITRRIAALPWTPRARGDAEAQLQFRPPTVTVVIDEVDPEKLRGQLRKHLHGMLSPEAIDELVAAEPRLRKYASQDPALAATLLTDPEAGFAAAKLELSPQTLRELRDLRQRVLRPEALDGLARIATLAVKPRNA